MRWFHVQLVILTLLFGSVVFLASRSWSSGESPAVLAAIDHLGGEWVGRPAPNFELMGSDGKTHRLADYRGQVIFLNFWASFCIPCREEMPSMERLVRQYENQGMVMVAISHDPKIEDMHGFMQQFLPGERSSMTLLWDPEVSTAPRYGTELIPETYIIDREGRIVA